MQASELLNELYTKGSKALQIFRKNAVSPHDSKVLKEWGISDAARMVDRTSQTLRNLEEAGKIPVARTKQKGIRTERVYNLAEINEIRSRLGVKPSKPKGTKAVKIGVCNFKGGVGKSSSSITIAQSLSLRGYRVLLIDSDSQGTSTHLAGGLIPDLHVSSDQTLLDILIGKDTNLQKCILKTHWDGVDLIPANLTLYNVEMLVPNQIYEHKLKTGKPLNFFSRLANSLESIDDQYDVIIIDTPPSLGFITMNVLFASQGLLIPLLPSEVDYCSTIQFLSMAHEALSRLPNHNYDFVRLLISRHKPSSLQAKTMENAIRQVFGSSVMTSYMIESEAISKASVDMKTIYEVESHTNDKKTFSRAINYAEQVTSEILLLINMIWGGQIENTNKSTSNLSEVV